MLLSVGHGRLDRRGFAELLRGAEVEAIVDVRRYPGVWWRCHRRLVADVVVLRRIGEVRHLMHDGRLVPHPPAEGARIRPDGAVVWDG
jgi:uncharacterized protein (DUF488 family)